MRLRPCLSYVGYGAFLYGIVACGSPLDTRRQADEPQSLGTLLYEEICHRVAHGENPRDVSGQMTYGTCRYGDVPTTAAGLSLVALTAERKRFIAAVDTAVDPNLVNDLYTLMGHMLPLYDDGTMQAHMASLAEALQGLAQAPDAVDALGRLAARRGYVRAQADFAQACLSYDRLDTLTRTLLRGSEFGTGLGADANTWHLLQRSIAEQLETAPETFLGGEGFTTLTRFLLSSLPQQTAVLKPQWVVRRDVRGMAVPTTQRGQPVTPFTDQDGDGMADVDSLGHYVGTDGLPLAGLPTPFPVAAVPDRASRTPHARAVRPDGQLWYEYRDTAPTVLAGFMEQLRDLMGQAPQAALSWLAVLQAAAGTPTARSHVFADGATFVYGGFDAASSPWLDIVEGLAAAADGPELAAFLHLADAVWTAHEPAVAQLLSLLWQADAWQQAQPVLYAPKLTAGASIAPDLFAIMAQMAREPGLLEDLLAAFAHPVTAGVGPRLAEQMRYADAIDFDPTAINGPPVGQFTTSVRREQPDAQGNQSVFEKLLYLVHDGMGRKICSNALDDPFPAYVACELFEIDDAAIFYVRAMAGTATLTMRLKEDDFFLPEQFAEAAEQNVGRSEMEAFTGIEGFTKLPPPPGCAPSDLVFRVSPQAAARLLFAMYDERVADNSSYGQTRAAAQMVTPRLMVDGVPFDHLHQGTLFAWELNGFFEVMQPLLQAFASHGREDLLVGFIDTLHKHWPTQNSDTTQNTDPTRPNYAAQSGLSRFEPLFARLLDEGEFVGHLGALIQAVESQPVGASQTGPQVVAQLLRHMVLPEHHPDLTPLRLLQKPSCNQPTTPASLLTQGVTAVAAHLQASLPADSAAHKLLRQAAQQWLEVGYNGANYYFTNRQAHALTRAALQFAESQLVERHDLLDPEKRPVAIATRARDSLDSAPLQATLQLGAALAQTPAAGDELARFVTHLLGDRLDATLEATADMLQVLSDVRNLSPILKQAHVWLHPQSGLLSQSVHLMEVLQDIDVTHAMPRLLQGAVRDMGSETPLSALVDIFGRINRREPGNQEVLAAPDFRALLSTCDDLIHSPEHGFARLLQLVQKRLGAAGRS